MSLLRGCLILVCWTFPSHGRQEHALSRANGNVYNAFSQTELKQLESRRPARAFKPLDAVAKLLVAFDPAVGWQAHVAREHGCSFVTQSRSRLATSLAMTLPPLAERVFFVTGSTDGIGKFTAEQLAAKGCTVLIHGRNPAKIAATIEELQKLAPEAKLEGFQADISLMSEVRRLAAEVSSKYPVIHGLLNNAGTFSGDYTGKRVVTDEGNEYSLAVNVMAPFLLTSLLVDNVRASGTGRILITSSVSKGSGDYLDDLQLEDTWSEHRAYSLSKLCDAMLIAEMHERYGDAPKLCFHSMDPGTVDTKMLRAGWFSGGASVRSATRSFMMLTDDSYQQSSGRNLMDSFISSRPKRVQLWDELVSLTGAAWPKVAV